MIRHIKQALVIIRSAWQKNLTYRFTVVMYRIGEIVETLVIVLMWNAIYAANTGSIRGFTLSEMITYVLLGNLFAVATRNWLPEHISHNIRDGKISSFLVKPISYIKFTFINELGRVILSTSLSALAVLSIIAFFSDSILFNTNPTYLALIAVMIMLAFVTELIIGFLIGCVAFWTDEAGGLQASIERIKRFFAGGYFPLSLLPAGLAALSIHLPFAYSFYVPASLYLKKLTIADGLKGLGFQVIWIAILSLVLMFVWKRGLRRYEATGS